MSALALPQHAAHWAFEVAEDQLCIGGRSVVELAASVGSTPFYAYSRDALERRLAELRAALPAPVELHYAIKANPLPELVSFIAERVDGLDVASGGELAIALGTQIERRNISFAGPGKRREELEQAAAAGIVVNLESQNEMRMLDAIARERGLRPRVALRINPDYELKISGMKMGGGPKQFGIDAELMPAVLAQLRGLELEFVGFHIFGGSQSLRADAICDAQSRALELAATLAAHAPAPVRVLNIGGGFGIPYFPGEQPLALDAIGRHLAQLLPQSARLLPQARLVIELGRFIVGEAGIYVCRVLDRKISRGQVFLVTDGGLHHHLAASGNFGQVLRKNYPVLVGNRVRGAQREIASVVGPLCTPLDLLADRMEMARAEVGDLIVVLQSGAYGRSASPLGFLSHPAPAEIIV